MIDLTDYTQELDCWAKNLPQKLTHDCNLIKLHLEQKGATDEEIQQVLELMGYSEYKQPNPRYADLPPAQRISLHQSVGSVQDMKGDSVRNFSLYWDTQIINGLIWSDPTAWNSFTAGNAKIHARDIQDKSIITARYDHGIDQLQTDRVSFHLNDQGKIYKIKNLSGFVTYDAQAIHLVYVYTTDGNIETTDYNSNVLYNIGKTK